MLSPAIAGQACPGGVGAAKVQNHSSPRVKRASASLVGFCIILLRSSPLPGGGRPCDKAPRRTTIVAQETKLVATDTGGKDLTT